MAGTDGAAVLRDRFAVLDQMRDTYLDARPPTVLLGDLAREVSVRAVAEYLAHADPGFTLRVYAHLMPDDESRALSVVDAALGSRADQVRTSGVVL